MHTPDTPAAQAAADRYIAELTATFEAAAGGLATVGGAALVGEVATVGTAGVERLEATGAGRLG
jgi:hypothetical protein